MKPTVSALLSLLLILPAFASPTPDDGKPHQFTAHDNNFYLDGQPFRIFAGEIHPGRIPPQFWDDRIKKAKAMGLNTVSAYLFWNQIEPSEGNFVFADNTDIRRFAQLCQANGMWMILRSGPYICGEWEFGGFPGWLLKHPGIGLRQDEPQFLKFSNDYIQKIHDQLGDLQVTHGGPILIVQVENEYHAINDYLRKVAKMYVDAGFDTQLTTCDPGGNIWNQMGGGIPGVLRGYNGFNSTTESRYVQSTKINTPLGYPVLSPEVYTGWFNTWGPVRKPPFVPIDRQVADLKWLLSHKNLSWTYYVFDGGTNFGFMAGANQGTPMQTSYDYDAPIDEIGRITPKYKAMRDVFASTLKLSLPPIPPDPAVIGIPPFDLRVDAPLLWRLPEKSTDSENVLTMEMLDQNYGFIDYRRNFPTGLTGRLDLAGARDYAIAMIDGQVVAEAFNGYGPRSFAVDVNHPGPCTLDILVHNLGRDSLLSVPNRSIQTKGLNRNPTLDGQPLTNWKIYSLPLDDPSQLPAAPAVSKTPDIAGPTFYTGSFTVPTPGETYLDMSRWHMGVVWVNGHNLGRYWNVGDAHAIYLPSVWQKPGENSIEVLELGTPPDIAKIQGVDNLLRKPATRFHPFWTAQTSPTTRQGG